MIRRYFYDFEFLEDGRTIEPISVGVVCDDGREFYAVNEAIGGTNDLNTRIRRHPWLMENVVPHLPLSLKTYGGKGYRPFNPVEVNTSGQFVLDSDSLLVQPLDYIRKGLKAFLLEPGDPIELWAYYAAYDHVALAQLLGGPMANMPAGIPFWTHDLMQELDRHGIVDPKTRWPMAAGCGAEHNALADARWNYQVWQQLAELNDPTEAAR